jgi:hypothetical protein
VRAPLEQRPADRRRELGEEMDGAIVFGPGDERGSASPPVDAAAHLVGAGNAGRLRAMLAQKQPRRDPRRRGCQAGRVFLAANL